MSLRPMETRSKGLAENDWSPRPAACEPQRSVTPNAAEYNALVIPGGVMNPDKLRVVDEDG